MNTTKKNINRLFSIIGVIYDTSIMNMIPDAGGERKNTKYKSEMFKFSFAGKSFIVPGPLICIFKGYMADLTSRIYI